MNAKLQHHTHLALGRGGVIRRRDFLRSVPMVAVAGGGIASSAGVWADVVSANADKLRRQGRACILLWMQGGPSQFETFDPKPGHANGGETKAIDTVVPGIQFADNLPYLAKVADRLAVIRSLSTREGEHQRATFLMHTSYLPTASVQFPAMGAVVAHEIRNAACELPAFVRIGPSINAGNGGLLGTGFDAFTVQGAGRTPDNSRPTTDTTRFQSRLKLLGRLETASGIVGQEDHRQLYADASRMILSPRMEAFDLTLESAQAREAYGLNAVVNNPSTPAQRQSAAASQFGAACLLARRLVEAGVTFIELTLTGWDTHDNNFERTRTLCGGLDRPFAQLIADLEQRGLLDTTLVAWLGEFGRTPKINPRGGRDHYPRAFSAALAGGGIRGGRVIGKTDVSGEAVADRPVTEKDIFQTIYKSLGIDAHKENMSPIGRPIKIVDGGAPVSELFA